MQDTSSHALLDLLKNLQAPIGAVLGALAHWLFNRWKQKPETSILEARAEKTRAEARRLDGETINLAHDRIDELVIVNFQLRQDCLELQRKLDVAELRERVYDEDRRRAKAKAVLGLPETADSGIDQELDSPKS